MSLALNSAVCIIIPSEETMVRSVLPVLAFANLLLMFQIV